jgi:outer membrane usher protein FimD/PapC
LFGGDKLWLYTWRPHFIQATPRLTFNRTVVLRPNPPRTTQMRAGDDQSSVEVFPSAYY